ncbi:alkene reductase, partial [Pseudomonas sp. PCH199]
AQFDYIVDQLNAMNIVYLHVVEGVAGGPRDVAPFDFGALRKRFKNIYIGNNGYDLTLATSQLIEDKADLIAFGRPFIGNPDLVDRLKTGAPLSAFNPATLFGSGAAGYTDYPTFAESNAQKG